MIEFSGDFSEKNKKVLLKQNAKVGFFASVTASIIFGALIMVFAAIYDFWIITIFVIVLVFTIVIATAAPYIEKAKTLSMLLPKKISIDENGNIYVDLGRHTVSKLVTDVKKVIDVGDTYNLKFRFPKVSGFLCQKDLITQGTIEEFEQLFAGKIVRKKSKN